MWLGFAYEGDGRRKSGPRPAAARSSRWSAPRRHQDGLDGFSAHGMRLAEGSAGGTQDRTGLRSGDGLQDPPAGPDAGPHGSLLHPDGGVATQQHTPVPACTMVGRHAGKELPSAGP